MGKLSRSESVIESVGCGRFQVIQFIAMVFSAMTCVAFTVQFMSFGNYNPGWRCLDPLNETAILTDISTLSTIGASMKEDNNGWGLTDFGDLNKNNGSLTVKANGTSGGEYSLGECSVYKSCKNVEFNPETSTIVTEWGLVCDDEWIPSFIISLQMAGLLVGSSAAGIAGDALGRKFAMCLSMVSNLIFTLISLFSTSWQMFAACQFILGISVSFVGTLFSVYIVEFSTMKWRAIVTSFPAYPFMAAVFGLVCFSLRDWRSIHIVIVIVCTLGFIPVYWLPESIRWLEVKNKTSDFLKASQCIARCNGKMLSSVEELNNEAETKLETSKEKIKDVCRKVAQLFGREHRKHTLILTIPFFSVSLIYFAIAFGVKAMSGNFYLNLILGYAIEVIFDSVIMFAPNALGRKKAGFVFSGFSGICLFVAACCNQLVSGGGKFYGVTIPAMLGRISTSAFWLLLHIFIVELYPTEVRGAANSWGTAVATVGGIMAPVLIPNEADTVFICYAVMGGLSVFCAGLVMLLPETRGKTLKERLDEVIIDESEKHDTFA